MGVLLPKGLATGRSWRLRCCWRLTKCEIAGGGLLIFWLLVLSK